MKELKVGKETVKYGNQLDALYKAGKLFDKKGNVRKSKNVATATDEFIKSLGRDFKKKMKISGDVSARIETLYNYGQFIIFEYRCYRYVLWRTSYGKIRVLGVYKIPGCYVL